MKPASDTVLVRFQHGDLPDVSSVLCIDKSWTWSALLEEVSSGLSVSQSTINHLVLLNKNSAEISLNIVDFPKFKRILTMYSNPDDMRFKVVLKKKAEEVKQNKRLRFRLSTNPRRNLDINIPEEAKWEEISELLSSQFSMKNPVDHLVLVDREGERVSSALVAEDTFWALASTFSIERDGVFVVYDAPDEASETSENVAKLIDAPRADKVKLVPSPASYYIKTPPRKSNRPHSLVGQSGDSFEKSESSTTEMDDQMPEDISASEKQLLEPVLEEQRRTPVKVIASPDRPFGASLNVPHTHDVIATGPQFPDISAAETPASLFDEPAPSTTPSRKPVRPPGAGVHSPERGIAVAETLSKIKFIPTETKSAASSPSRINSSISSGSPNRSGVVRGTPKRTVIASPDRPFGASVNASPHRSATNGLQFPNITAAETPAELFDQPIPSVSPTRHKKLVASPARNKEVPSDKTQLGHSSPSRSQEEDLNGKRVALFCLSEDPENVLRVVISDFSSWLGVVNPVAEAFGINPESVQYFILVDKDNDEISPFLRNEEKFWKIYEKKFSLTNGTKFSVEVDRQKMAQDTFPVCIRLSDECSHLVKENPTRHVLFRRDCDWNELSSAVSKAFDFPAVSVHHFIVLDVDGDEMSPHITVPETFWKSAATFKRDHGDSISVHLDDNAIKMCLQARQRQEYLSTAARFLVELDCDKYNRNECTLLDNSPWSDLVREIIRALQLTSGSTLLKIVLLDADRTVISPDITTEQKFWKIYNVKYKKTENSFFSCSFTESARQKAFFGLCATGNQTSTLNDLIKKGVDVNGVCDMSSVAGVDPAMQLRAVHLAARGGHVATLRVLCSVDCVDVHYRDAEGRTPMYYACQSTSGECIQILVEKGANFQGEDTEGKTPIHWLAINGVEFSKNAELRLHNILNGRIDISSTNAFDENGVTPLMYASMRGDLTVTKVLVSFGAIVNLRDRNGMSPLLHAVKCGSLKLVQYLVGKNASISARNDAGDDALLICASTGNQDIAEYLVSQQKMDAQTRNAIGHSCYQVAAASSHPALAQWFAAHGSGKTLLSAKAQRHLFQTDQSLEKRLRADEIKFAEQILGVPIRSFEPSVDFSDTSSPKSDPSQQSSREEARSTKKSAKQSGHHKVQNLSLLHETDDAASPNKLDLFNACKCGDIDKVRELCRVFGESLDIVNVKATTGDSLLHIACYVHNLELCKFLFRQGVPVTARNNNGYTPFHAACEEGLYEISLWMCSVASCAVTDDDAMMPIHYACRQQRTNIIKVLINAPDCLLATKDKNGMLPMQYIVGWKGVNDSQMESILIEMLQSQVADVTTAATILLPDAALAGLLTVVHYILEMDCCSVDIICYEDGQSALHRACRGGKIEIARLLIRKKADIYLRDDKEMTPFLHACTSGNLELAKYIYSCGQKDILTAIDCNGDNALHFCTRSHDTDMVQWLLERGLDCNQPNFSRCAPVDLPEASDWSELKLVYREHQIANISRKPKERRLLSKSNHDATAIYDICAAGAQEELFALVESGYSLDVEAKDNSGYTALHIACQQGNYSVAAILTKNGCHCNLESRNGETPLYLACSSGSLNIVKLLVECGVNCRNLVRQTTVLHVAASMGHIHIVSWLVSVGVNVGIPDANGFTAIHIACRDGNLDAVKSLFELGASIRVDNASAPLHVACFLGNFEIAKWLVSKGADPNDLHEGRNSFLIACSGGQKDIAVWLESIGADIRCLNEVDGMSALHRACKAGNVALCDWLLTKNKDFLLVHDANDESPLFLALSLCNDDLVDLMEKHILASMNEADALDEIREDMLDLLVRTLPDDDVTTAMFVLRRLMAHTDAKHVFSDGCTLLHFAAAIGDVDSITYLVNHDALVNVKSIEGKTPLHYAAITGKITSAEELIKFGANCRETDNDDRDAIRFASYFKHKKFVKWLKSHSAYTNGFMSDRTSLLFACLPVAYSGNAAVDFHDSDSDDVQEVSEGAPNDLSAESFETPVVEYADSADEFAV